MQREENTLNNVVSHFLLEGGFGDAEYTRAYHIASRGLREMSMDMGLGHEYVTEAFINADGTVDFPVDAVKVLSIKRKIGDSLVALTRNPDLSKLGCSVVSCDCHVCTHKTNVRCERFGTSPYWDGGSLGIGSWQNNGEYAISGNLIYLSQNACSEGCVIIEYKGFPVSETEDVYVHPYVREALIAYLRWMFAINRKNQDKWDKQYYEKEWHRLKRNAKYRLKSPTKQELNQITRQHTKGGLKS